MMMRTANEHSSIWGLALGIGIIIGSILLQGSLLSFFDFTSVIIVFGGTLAASAISFSASDLKQSFTLAREALISSSATNETFERMSYLVELAKKAHKEGVLSLENHIYGAGDQFLSKALSLCVDGLTPQEIRRILAIEISFLEDKYKKAASVFFAMGSISPALGLVGTLLGLVQMLKNLDTPSSIGPAMAVALLTTFYGAILSNLVFIPIANKLSKKSTEEKKLKELTAEGIVAISEGLNPRHTEQNLFGFIAPEERVSIFGY